jgi:tRNA/tmRNA/rRNA uracil-C5-methylase (TrmA/RlmC/RlmD family)
MEIEGPAVNAAINNARHLFPDKSCRFVTGAITLENIQSKLPPVNMPEIVILDPPRQGTAQGVIAAIAERRPVQVIHIFCGTDKISEETSEWERNGYKLKTIIPLDMFPGSPNLETVVVLKPEK